MVIWFCNHVHTAHCVCREGLSMLEGFAWDSGVESVEKQRKFNFEATLVPRTLVNRYLKKLLPTGCFQPLPLKCE